MSTDLFHALTFEYPSPYPFLICAGPCSAETEEQTYETARQLRARGIRLFRASLWKPRTRPGSFEGVGAEGLSWLRRIEQELGMQAMTEVASAAHVEACLRAGIRTLWVGARTTASPFAVSELAEALRGEEVTLLVKNPLNPDLELWEGATLPRCGYRAPRSCTPRLQHLRQGAVPQCPSLADPHRATSAPPRAHDPRGS